MVRVAEIPVAHSAIIGAETSLSAGTIVLLIMAFDTFYLLNPVYYIKRAKSSSNSKQEGLKSTSKIKKNNELAPKLRVNNNSS